MPDKTLLAVIPSSQGVKMLRKFLLTGGIAVVVWGTVFVLPIPASGQFSIPEWVGLSLYITGLITANPQRHLTFQANVGGGCAFLLLKT